MKNISLRRPRVEDLEKIRNLEKSYEFQIPSKFIHAAVAVDGEEILAFGLIRFLIEAVLVCDGRKRQKVESISQLLSQMTVDAKSLKIPQIHAFVRDEIFADILIKKFNFIEEKGKALVLNVGE